MKRWILPLLLVISLGVNIGFLLHRAWPKILPGRSAGSGPSRSGWHASPMKRHLGLNARQVRQMESDRQQVLAQIRPLQDELRLKRRQLFILLKEGEVPQAEMDSALSDISRLQAAIEKIFIVHSLKMRGHFSPAQMHKFEGYLERGLCPNLGAEAACPPGAAAAVPGCGNADEGKKAISKR
jgi:hypothetical protein